MANFPALICEELELNNVYLAGPTVFFRDASEHFKILAELCRAHQICAVLPADLEDVRGNTPHEIASAIREENLRRIRAASGVLANLAPFRNPVEPDSGTVYECGYANALGIPTCGYLPGLKAGHAGRIISAFGVEYLNGMPFDTQWGHLIEDFAEPANLMLSCGMPIFETPAEALEALNQLIRKERERTMLSTSN